MDLKQAKRECALGWRVRRDGWGLLEYVYCDKGEVFNEKEESMGSLEGFFSRKSWLKVGEWEVVGSPPALPGGGNQEKLPDNQWAPEELLVNGVLYVKKGK